MRNRRVRLLTVAGPAGSADVVVAADALLVHLLPMLADQFGGGALPSHNPRWVLYDELRRPLTTASLAAQGVVDGDILTLSCTGPPPSPAEAAALSAAAAGHATGDEQEQS